MIGHRGLDDEPEESDGCMFGPRSGSWALYSKLDPRWNVSGESKTISIVEMAPEAKKALRSLRKRYGKTPKDLEYSCMKD